MYDLVLHELLRAKKLYPYCRLQPHIALYSHVCREKPRAKCFVKRDKQRQYLLRPNTLKEESIFKSFHVVSKEPVKRKVGDIMIWPWQEFFAMLVTL